MVDKPNDIRNQSHAHAILDVIRLQIEELRLIGREAQVLIIGKSEDRRLVRHLGSPNQTCQGARILGLDVEVDGDVGVRVG